LSDRWVSRRGSMEKVEHLHGSLSYVGRARTTRLGAADSLRCYVFLGFLSTICSFGSDLGVLLPLFDVLDDSVRAGPPRLGVDPVLRGGPFS
jgi:hypothetical protein